MGRKTNIYFDVLAPFAIDSRLFKKSKSDLDLILYKYEHMLVHVIEEDLDYRFYPNSTPQWVAEPRFKGVEWGSIGGNLNDQTDLKLVLDGKSDVGHTHPPSTPSAHTHQTADIQRTDGQVLWTDENVAPNFVITGSDPSNGPGPGFPSMTFWRLRDSSNLLDITEGLDVTFLGAQLDPTGRTMTILPDDTVPDHVRGITPQNLLDWDAAYQHSLTEHLQLGTSEVTAFRGDLGLIAYTHSQAAHAPIDAEKNVNADWFSMSGDSQILNKPSLFPPEAHNHPISDIIGLQTELDTLGTDISNNTLAIQAHESRTDNPHAVTKAQVGLGSVENLSPADLPLSDASINALDLKVDKEAGKGLSTNDFTDAYQTKLDGVEDGAQVNVKSDWLSVSGDSEILNKPAAFPPQNHTHEISDVTGLQGELDNKVDKITGKGLSEEDYTTVEKDKLSNIEAGAEVNVQSDWNATVGDALILNKPTTLDDFSNAIPDPFVKVSGMLGSVIPFDNTGSQMTSTLVDNAIKEAFSRASIEQTTSLVVNLSDVPGLTATNALNDLKSRIDNMAAVEVSYDNSATTLDAVEVQAAINELSTRTAGGLENGIYKFSTEGGAPGLGRITLDTDDLSATEVVYVNNISDAGTDIRFYMEGMNIGDRILIQAQSDATNFIRGILTGEPVDNGSYWSLPIDNDDNGGSFQNNERLGVAIRYFNLQGGDADTLQGEPKSYFLSKEEFEMTERANLILGGVGGTINTPALLAEKFSFVESDVSEFKVIVNTVYAVIDVEYTTINVGGGLGSFTNNTEITSIYDGGNLKELNHSTFENASNLTSVELLGADVPVLAGVNKETFQEIGLLTKFNLPSLTYFDTNFIKNQTHPIGVDLDLSGVTSFASLGSFTTYKKVNLSSVTTIDRNGALGYSFYEELDIRNCTSFGDPTTDQSVFESITSGSHIIANYIHETSNNGGVDATLAYAIGSGATVEYIGQPEGLLAPSDIQLTPNYGLPSTTQDVVIDCIDMTSESIVKFSGDITVNSQSVELNNFGSLQIRANITHGVTEGAIDVTVWNGYETVFSGAYSILDTGTPEQYNDNYMTADDVPSTDTLYHYYIDNTNGDDATGVIGRIDKPFQTIDAVYSELPILNIDESYIQLNLMRGGSYPVNGKQPFNNFIFKSGHNVNLDYSNNANTALQVFTTSTLVVFDIPNGEITFNPNVDQLYTASFDIYCRKITTGRNTSATSAQFSTIKTAKIAVVVLTNQLFYQAGQGANVWVKSIETKMTQGRLFCAESSGGKDANIYIGRVYGTGEFVAAGTSGYVSIGNVSCDGDLIIQDIVNSRTTLHFRNSLITNAWTMTDWNMGHLVLTGSIRDGSGNFTGGNPSNTNSSVTFKDFYCDFGSGIFNVELLDFVTIINSVIKCDGIPFKVTQASTINFYGNSIIKSSSPSSFRTGGFATTLNIEGELQTNIDLSNDIQVTVVETPLFAYGGKKNRKEITASYTVNPKEDKYTIWLNSPTPITITVDDTLPESFECEFYNIGAGLVTFVGGTGTLNAPDGSTLATDKVAAIMKVMNTNDYRLKGDLA